MGQCYNRIAVLILWALFVIVPICRADVYVATTGDDSTGDGTISSPYRYIQTGVDALAVQGPGNTLYLRGGVYTTVPTDGTNRGIEVEGLDAATSWDNAYVIRSYPGEWAIIDGSNYTTENRVYGFQNSCVNSFPCDLQYIELSHMEIRNFYGLTHCNGISFRGGPFKFNYLYIHDNNCATVSNNPGGLGTYIGGADIAYCVISGNGYLVNSSTAWSGENSSNIVLFSDYNYTTGMTDLYDDSTGAPLGRHSNIVRYCYISGESETSGYFTPSGIKEKGRQFMEGYITGATAPLTDIYNFKDARNQYHHNIWVDHLYSPVYLSSDFSQVYNNIIVSNTDQYWTSIYSCHQSEGERNTSHETIYNNTIIGGSREKGGIDFTANSTDVSEGELLYTCYNTWYAINNILYAVSDADGRKDISVNFAYSRNKAYDADNLLHILNNMFYAPPNTILATVNVVDYTISTMNSAMWGSGNISDDYDSGDLLFAGTTGADQYKLNSSYTGYTTVSTGGYNQSHPYLSGVTIPAYIGAVNPSDNDWVDGILALDAAYMTTAENDPAWIEGSAAPTTRYYLDTDGDGYSPGDYQDAESDPGETWYTEAELTSIVLVDCDDSNTSINPGTTEVCGNEVDEDCDGTAQACQSTTVTTIGNVIIQRVIFE